MALNDREAATRIARLLDGTADPWELDAIATAAREETAFREQLRQHLVIDEVLSQLLAPERTADAFLSGVEERQRIDEDAVAFTAQVLAAAQAAHARAAVPARRWPTPGPVLIQGAGLLAACLAVALLGLLLSHLPGAASGAQAGTTAAALDPGLGSSRLEEGLLQQTNRSGRPHD